MYRTECFKPDTFVPTRFESDHEITLHGKTVPYHTVCEDNVFYNKDGRPIASMYSYSYFRSDVKDTADRPVIFGFNGGPGSSSVYVHAGFLGTRRIVYGEPDRPSAFGPYKVIDNPDCLLDIADLVLIDPVGTGYGVLIDEEESKSFYGVEEDAEALLTFMEMWTRRYSRALSPKYMVGESYGCIRSATAAGIAASGGKDRTYGVAFDGIVMIGNTVTQSKDFNANMPADDCVFGFPTYAGVNWYHNHPTDQPVEEFVAEAREFASMEYNLALFEGDALNEEEREHIIERVCYYTGVSREYLIKNGLKINDDTYRTEVLKAQGKAVSRYDGRVTRPLLAPEIDEEKKAAEDDATADRYDAYFYAALTGDILPMMGVKLDRSYVMCTMAWKTWNNETPLGSSADQLRCAMSRRPGMRTFFANGWFDLCTEFGYLWYTLNHSHLPKDRVFVKGYPSGHMIYIGEHNVKTLLRDIRKFVEKKDPTK
jgi:carboxypeptidase C (cathepsin A)